ncbi:MAG: SpoIIE family protein phosphatase [Bacteroidales bacterium]|nr:SpoIIE family protein phosphatase [Bacteroidales bacterium]
MPRINTLLVALSLLWASLTTYAQTEESDPDVYLDSLYHAAMSLPEDTNRLVIFNKIATEHYNVDSTMHYAQLEYDLATRLNNHHYALWGLHYIAWSQFYMTDYVSCISTNLNALQQMTDNEEPMLRSLLYINIADSYSMMSESMKAIDFYRKALDVALQNDLDYMNFLITMNIAESYLTSDMYENALTEYNKAKEIKLKMEKPEAIADLNSGIGRTYVQMYVTSEKNDTASLALAKSHLLTAYELYSENLWNGVTEVITSYSDMILHETHINEYDDRRKLQLIEENIRMINAGMSLEEKIGNDLSVYHLKLKLADNCIVAKRYNEAEHIIDSLQHVVNLEDLSDPFVEDIYNTLGKLYKLKGDYKMYSRCLETLRSITLKNNRVDYASKAARTVAEAEYENNMRRRDMEQMRRETELQAAARWRMYVIGLLGIIALLAIILAIRRHKSNKQLNERNERLLEQQEEITAQNESLEQQKSLIEVQNIHLESQNKLISDNNNQMLASLRYASTIQKAAMPTEVQMHAALGENFIIYRPLNIVSGDFYWAANTHGCRILAVADCTGHGVPGAFLSMLGISILNDIMSSLTLDDLSAAHLLDTMNRKFKQALRQNGKDDSNHDGIDMAVVIVEPDASHLHYAGAFRPLVVISDHKATRYAPDRISIGTSIHEGNFTDNIVDIHKDDVIYLFSDGITDQFGSEGSNEMKFSLKRLVTILEDIAPQPMSLQKQKLEITLDQWRLSAHGTISDQLDDTLIVGFRI